MSYYAHEAWEDFLERQTTEDHDDHEEEDE
jgi:hypothetical protein